MGITLILIAGAVLVAAVVTAVIITRICRARRMRVARERADALIAEGLRERYRVHDRGSTRPEGLSEAA